MRRIPLCSLVLCLPAALASQTYPEGYATSVRSLPATAGTVLQLDAAQVVYFTGTQLVLDDGTNPRVLLAFAIPVFGSFTIRSSATDLLFGESSGNTVWRVPLAGGAPQQLATIVLNYAADLWGSNHALVSAKTGGFGSMNNEVIALDLTTGATDVIAELPGASGPLVVDANGDLLYATASNSFPPPLGSSDVVRFSAAAVASAFGPTKLSINQGSLVHQGLDTVSSMTLDDDGDLQLVDWWNNQLVELDDVDQPPARKHVLADYATAAMPLVAVQFVKGAGPAVFEPFQRNDGQRLVVHEQAFGGPSQLRLVDPNRAATTASPDPVPPGPLALTTIAGPALGVAAVAFGQGALEIIVGLPGFEQPAGWAFATQPPAVILPATFDANGKLVLALTNPGASQPFVLTCQVAFVDAAGRVLGTSVPATFTVH